VSVDKLDLDVAAVGETVLASTPAGTAGSVARIAKLTR
jgi:hypothetical protein